MRTSTCRLVNGFRRTTDGCSATAGSFSPGCSPLKALLPHVGAATHTSLATADARQIVYVSCLLASLLLGRIVPQLGSHISHGLSCVRPGGAARYAVAATSASCHSLSRSLLLPGLKEPPLREARPNHTLPPQFVEVLAVTVVVKANQTKKPRDAGSFSIPLVPLSRAAMN